jgi:hypothetical protein
MCCAGSHATRGNGDLASGLLLVGTIIGRYPDDSRSDGGVDASSVASVVVVASTATFDRRRAGTRLCTGNRYGGRRGAYLAWAYVDSATVVLYSYAL